MAPITHPPYGLTHTHLRPNHSNEIGTPPLAIFLILTLLICFVAVFCFSARQDHQGGTPTGPTAVTKEADTDKQPDERRERTEGQL